MSCRTHESYSVNSIAFVFFLYRLSIDYWSITFSRRVTCYFIELFLDLKFRFDSLKTAHTCCRGRLSYGFFEVWPVDDGDK